MIDERSDIPIFKKDDQPPSPVPIHDSAKSLGIPASSSTITDQNGKELNPLDESLRLNNQKFTSVEALQLCIGVTDILVNAHYSNIIHGNLGKQNILWDRKNNSIGITGWKDQQNPENTFNEYVADHKGIANLLYFTLSGKDLRQEISTISSTEGISSNQSIWENINPVEKNIISRIYSLNGETPYENSRIGTETILIDLQRALIKQPLDTDLILTTDMMIDNPFINKEILRNAAILRSDTIQAIRDGTSLIINRQFAYGDNMLHMWAYNFMLRKLCEQEDLDPEKINLRVAPDGDEFMLLENRVKSIIQYDDMDINTNFYLSRLTLIARALNIKLAEGTERYIPQPIKMEGTVFEKFNEEYVKEQGNQIRQGTDKKIITVVQSGSTAEKRFSDEQVIQLVNHIKNILPDSYIQIVSDKAFRDTSNQDVSEFNKVADAVTASTDINETCAHFYASDHIFTTDSFWGWLSSGTRVMNEDRKGRLEPGDVLILYTLAFPKHWSIPGSDIVKSPYLDHYDSDEPVKGGMIVGSQYLYKHMWPTRKEYGIYDEDIHLYKAAIRRQLLNSD